MIEIRTDISSAENELTRVLEKAKAPGNDVMKAIGFEVAQRCKMNIVEGIGTAPPSQRVLQGKGDTTLYLTGNMSRSITVMRAGASDVDVGSVGKGEEYIMKHIKGDPGGQAITEKVRAHKRISKSGKVSTVSAHTRNTTTRPTRMRNFTAREELNPGFVEQRLNPILDKELDSK